MADRELALPLRLDGQGRMATMSDPKTIAAQHLTTYLLTRKGERVMRPDFGSPVKDYTFENLDPLSLTLLTQRVQQQVGRDVTNVRLISFTADEDYAEGALHLTVEFALAMGAGDGTTQTTTLTLGGTA